MEAELQNIVSVIDHTLLKATATPDEVRRLCEGALEAHQIAGVSPAAVCVNGSDVGLCADILRGSSVRVCSVIGFPLGRSRLEVKLREAELCLGDGATEIDTVINLGDFLSGNIDAVRAEINALSALTRAEGAVLKVIIESGTLETEELVRSATEIVLEGQADYVKTSTGFSGTGATVEHVQLMRSVAGDALGVKASGGIRTADDALKMIAAGASRIGASAGLLQNLLEQLK